MENTKLFLKYDPNEADPLLICADCRKISAREYLTTEGGCHFCGNRRFKTIVVIDEEDRKQLEAGTYDLGIGDYEVDPKYFSLFEEAEA